MADIYDRLRSATYDLFPKTGSWSSDCFRQSEDSLIAHLRNTEWLAKKLSEALKDVDPVTIRAFVRDSEFFREQRESYEQMIVRWQIEWMISGGENWIVKDEYGGDFIDFDPRCDIGFRQGILDTLLAIGMNREAIERGIEENANLWRDTYMMKAFRNKYDPIELFTRRSDKPFEHTSEKHLEKWLRFRRYQYYQDHKDSVDNYGTQKNAMDMNTEDVEALTIELALLDQERMQYLSDYKENSTIVPFGLDLISEEKEEPTTPPPIQETPRKGIKSLVKRLFTGK